LASTHNEGTDHNHASYPSVSLFQSSPVAQRWSLLALLLACMPS
jgi:hypothetical protein